MTTTLWPTPGDALDDMILADGAASVTSTLVPGTYPVAIGGHSYPIEVSEYRRRTLDAYRIASDFSATPGEQSLSTEGYWTRSQRTWLYGAGQTVFDSPDSGVDNLIQRQRWMDSWNVEPDVEEGVKMLRRKATTYSATSVGTYRNGNQAVQAGTVTYFLHLGVTPVVKMVDPAVGVTDCTGFVGNSPQAIASDGYNVWVATGPSTTTIKWYSTTAGSTVFAAMAAGNQTVATHDRAVALYANGWLLIIVNGVIYSVDSTGLHSTAIDTISPVSGTTSNCQAMTASATHWYFAMSYFTTTRNPTTIHKLSIDDTGAFGKASVALPPLSSNEFVQCMLVIGGVMVIGTNAGFRIAVIDTDGTLSEGPLIQITDTIDSANLGVTSLAKFGSVVVGATWEDRFDTNVDASFQGSTAGLIKIDVSRFVDQLQPSWWFWWRAATTSANAVSYVGSNMSAPIVLIDQTFYALGATDLVTPASVVTSWVSIGFDRDKSFIDIEVYHDPLASGDTIAVYYQLEDQSTWSLAGTSQSAGTVSNPDPFPVRQISRRVRFAFVLTAGSATQSTTPRIRRWMLRAYPAPRLVEEIIVPIILHAKTKDGDLEDIFNVFDTHAEQVFLRDLAQSGAITIYQFGTATEEVKVSKLEMQPSGFAISEGTGGYYDVQGILVARLLTL